MSVIDRPPSYEELEQIPVASPPPVVAPKEDLVLKALEGARERVRQEWNTTWDHCMIGSLHQEVYGRHVWDPKIDNTGRILSKREMLSDILKVGASIADLTHLELRSRTFRQAHRELKRATGKFTLKGTTDFNDMGSQARTLSAFDRAIANRKNR